MTPFITGSAAFELVKVKGCAEDVSTNPISVKTATAIIKKVFLIISPFVGSQEKDLNKQLLMDTT
jgi:hypothetical protein